MKKTKITLAFIIALGIILTGIFFGKNEFETQKPDKDTKVKHSTTTKTKLGYVKDMTVSCYTLVETPSDGKFANGEWATSDQKVIASNALPFGTKVEIQGFDGKYVVKDRMQAGWQHADLDIYFGDTLEDYRECKEWGKKELEVLVLQDKDSTFTE